MEINSPEKHFFQPNILVISGGGPKGIAFIGVLEELEKITSFDIKKLKILSGSSIGGVICTAICLGYTIKEMKDWFISVDFTSLCPSMYDEKYTSKILPMVYNTFSLSSGSEIKKILYKTFLFKSININITFKELYEITNKLLVLSGSNLNNKQGTYFSYEKTPDMKVFEALLITTRIPYIFPYVEYDNNIYVDGHLFDPFPIKGCGRKNIKENKGKILGIISISSNDDNKIKNIKQYTFSIIEGISYQYMKKATEKYKKYIISVKINMGFFNVKTSTKEMENMFEDGQEAARLYIQKNKKC